MALRAQQIVETPTMPEPAARPWSSTAGAPAGVSAVRDMQAALERSLAAEASPDKWSKRRTLTFIVAVCGTFWGAVLFALLG